MLASSREPTGLPKTPGKPGRPWRTGKKGACEQLGEDCNKNKKNRIAKR